MPRSPEPRMRRASSIRHVAHNLVTVLIDLLLLAAGLATTAVATFLADAMLRRAHGMTRAKEWHGDVWIELLVCSLVAPTVLVLVSRRVGRPMLALAAIGGTILSLSLLVLLHMLSTMTIGF